MQACMDSSDWLKGIANEDAGTNSSSPLSAEVIPSPRQLGSPLPPIDRRLRPQHDQPLKCPRCDSSHTKFCYYNNYSLSQPRYFCKTCRRYWTKGGSLRNVPVGGGCRKNKRTNPKKQSGINMPNHHLPAATALHLSFSGLQLPLQESSANFSEWKYGYGLGLNLENKFLGGAEGGELGIGAINNGFDLSGLHALNALRFSIGANGGVHGQEMGAVQGLSLPFLGHDESNEVDVKPAGRALPVEWHEPYCCADSNRETSGFPNETGMWGPMMGNHGPSTAI